MSVYCGILVWQSGLFCLLLWTCTKITLCLYMSVCCGTFSLVLWALVFGWHEQRLVASVSDYSGTYSLQSGHLSVLVGMHKGDYLHQYVWMLWGFFLSTVVGCSCLSTVGPNRTYYLHVKHTKLHLSFTLLQSLLSELVLTSLDVIFLLLQWLCHLVLHQAETLIFSILKKMPVCEQFHLFLLSKTICSTAKGSYHSLFCANV